MYRQNASAASRRRGFTLLELIVVITIIGILGTIVAVNLTDTTPYARQVKIESDIDAILQVARSFHAQVGRYPDTIDEMVDATDSSGRRLMVRFDEPPKDPWGKQYVYELADDGPTIICLGSDGTIGGEGEAADTVKPAPNHTR